MTATPASTPGVRVILDARPIQAPERWPVTATYAGQLVEAFDAEPLAGESFVFLLASELDDPTSRFRRLEVVGRRLLPPTRLLRSVASTVDPFVVRGATIGAAWRAERRGAAGAVHHTLSGTVPVASGLPVVATLLDLAPWEIPAAFGRGPARLGHRLRARLLHDAAAVIVGTSEVARATTRLLRIRPSRIHVIALAARPDFDPGPDLEPGSVAANRPDTRRERERLGLPERYLVYTGRFDARHDPRTLLAALGELAVAGRPTDLPDDVAWPPRLLLAGASPADRAALARVADRAGVGNCLVYAPHLEPPRLAALVRCARAAVLPAVSEAAGLAAIEALACATPVVASAVGALPPIVGTAGILVEPRSPSRLAAALAAAWADERVHARIAAEARERAAFERRTWSDVARETRVVYALAARSARAAPR